MIFLGKKIFFEFYSYLVVIFVFDVKNVIECKKKNL